MLTSSLLCDSPETDINRSSYVVTGVARGIDFIFVGQFVDSHLS
jgi:hypothetical protein